MVRKSDKSSLVLNLLKRPRASSKWPPKYRWSPFSFLSFAISSSKTCRKSNARIEEKHSEQPLKAFHQEILFGACHHPNPGLVLSREAPVMTSNSVDFPFCSLFFFRRLQKAHDDCALLLPVRLYCPGNTWKPGLQSTNAEDN